jgi:RNA polymerase sigma-70 factor, ECF subfamily
MDSPMTSMDSALPAGRQARDELYVRIAAEFGAPLRRLTRAYELDEELRRDLFQDIQVELWNSLAKFEGACSLRTWAFRVAHNVGAKHILRQTRRRARHHVSLEEAADLPSIADEASRAEKHSLLDATLDLIHRLRAPDRQIMLLYLEDLDAQAIGEVVGLTPGNVATKIHRIKQLLSTMQRSQP